MAGHHRRSAKQLALSVAVLASLASACLGWGPDGHRIIAEIAERYLQPKTKAAIKDLLGDESLADASNWADAVRKEPQYEWSAPLHYINVPRTASKIDLARDCENGACVIAAINKYAGILRNRKAPREERIEALKFLIHFVGDVHQPLHVSYADDRGGNSVIVTWFGDADWNFHAVWDSALIKRDMSNDRAAVVKRLAAGISSNELRQWRTSTNPSAWANETLAITRKLYRELPADRQLDEAYYKANIGKVEERLTAAGVRLAMVLNDILGEGKHGREPKPVDSQPEVPATQPHAPATQPAVP